MAQNQSGHPLFSNTGFPTADVRRTPMIHTRTYAGHEQKFRTTFAQEVLTRYPGGGVRLFPLVDMLSSGTVNSTDYGFNIRNVAMPMLEIAEDVPHASPRQTTSIKVKNARFVLPTQLYTILPFGEQIQILAVNGDHELVVMRGLGSIMPTVIRAGTVMVFAGTAHPEGSLRPMATASTSSTLFIQSQIFRDSWALTDTARVVATANGENITSESKDMAMYNHSLSIELAMLLGQRSATVWEGKPMRTMSGLREYITACAPQNVWDITTALDYEALSYIFDSFGEVQVGNNPSMERIIYGDRSFVNAVSQLGRRMNYSVQIGMGTDTFGQRFKRFITERLSFTVYEHPLLNMPVVQNMMRGVGIVIDPTTMKLLYLPERKHRVTYFNTNGSNFNTIENDNGIDALGGSITSELMLVNTNPAASGIVYGFTQGACSGCK